MPRGKKHLTGQLGVATGNVVPLRSKPDSDSEQVSQALIGQSIVVEAGQRGWLFVQTWDNYRGWIADRDVRILEDQSQPYASSGNVAVVRELIVDVFDRGSERAGIITKATISSELEVVEDRGAWVEVVLPDGRSGFIRKHHAKLLNKDLAYTMWLPDTRKLVETAQRFVGVPYLWGGTSPFGIDCSGFVQLVHRVHYVTLLRDAQLQATDPRAFVVNKSDIRAGDLVFFAKAQGNTKSQGGRQKNQDAGPKSITHVGLAISSRRFIHSCLSSGVTITPLDDPYYAGIFWGAKRMRLATLDPGGGAPED